MEITDIDKSIKRANSGGTFKFFETKYLNCASNLSHPNERPMLEVGSLQIL